MASSNRGKLQPWLTAEQGQVASSEACLALCLSNYIHLVSLHLLLPSILEDFLRRPGCSTQQVFRTFEKPSPDKPPLTKFP